MEAERQIAYDYSSVWGGGGCRGGGVMACLLLKEACLTQDPLYPEQPYFVLHNPLLLLH